MVEREQQPIRPVEIRRAAPAGIRPVGGYAATFNEPAEIGGLFIEVLAPGCFTSALERGDDVLAVFNHDNDRILGRTSNGTLRLSQDAKGLSWTADPPDTVWARDLLVSIGRGDVSECSFAFIPIKETWKDNIDLPTRIVEDLQLFDVSAVSRPAYIGTSLGLRGSDMAGKLRANSAHRIEYATREGTGVEAEKRAAECVARAKRAAKITKETGAVPAGYVAERRFLNGAEVR